jgi:hypothetical protein
MIPRGLLFSTTGFVPLFSDAGILGSTFVFSMGLLPLNTEEGFEDSFLIFCTGFVSPVEEEKVLLPRVGFNMGLSPPVVLTGRVLLARACWYLSPKVLGLGDEVG